MTKRLFIGTAAASLLALGSAASVAIAQDANQPPQNGQPAVVLPQEPASNAPANDPGMETPGANTADPAAPAPAPEANATPATPPPSDAVISAQKDTDVRADQLIGMTVYNSAGEKVGTVHDIVLDKDGRASGVVLSVGGVLGLGAKSVGLAWKEIEMRPEDKAVQISYTKDQLEAAPDFKTTEQIDAEMNAQAPAPAQVPAQPSTGSSQSQ